MVKWPSASSGTGKPLCPMKPARQGESADQGGHSYLADIEQDQPWLGQKFAAQEGYERTQQDDCNHTEQYPSPPGQTIPDRIAKAEPQSPRYKLAHQTPVYCRGILSTENRIL